MIIKDAQLWNSKIRKSPWPQEFCSAGVCSIAVLQPLLNTNLAIGILYFGVFNLVRIKKRKLRQLIQMGIFSERRKDVENPAIRAEQLLKKYKK